MGKGIGRKIVNDPVHGFITIPNDLVFRLLQHPLFQRLNRIKQLGLAGFVYPGAQHTRFQHSLGAMHLTFEAIKNLRLKGHDITIHEEEAVLAAMLLHDVGHGPFSHVLENTLVNNISHEDISLLIMKKINGEMDGALTLAIDIFEDKYPKHFLHQLISSQLDMDRIDYLCRDCFYTGVTEGAIGADRIINMLNVHNDRLVVESKGIYSIENFLIARRLMYWQVYLHKTSVAAERLLINILDRARELVLMGKQLHASKPLLFFIKNSPDKATFESNSDALEYYSRLDDYDVISAIKEWCSSDDDILSLLSNCFINRKLYKAKPADEMSTAEIQSLVNHYYTTYKISEAELRYFITDNIVKSNTYNPEVANIMILFKDGRLEDVSKASDMLNVDMLSHTTEKKYIFYLPKI